ncbi:Very-short-patch-repair endonuclease [Xaviernesmea oryzae]|uniref:Very-short-patch-repair endonuclease n=2 Tax=Xaviernesmea oryzae TaxID=464029 RepID=A0A1X7CT90_9HYPH|nr:Very-short-patch-repair endonuclease [Xaviernesmea oryzae]
MSSVNMVSALPQPPSSDPSGHLLPAGEKGSTETAARSPFSPRGEGARRADEGATGTTKKIRQDIRKHRPGKTNQARQLRRNETEEEWSDLRARRLNGHKFARQVPLGPYIVDFLCREHGLIVEVDGSQHADNAYDRRRTDWLNAQGYAVLRFWNHEISHERRSVLETILAALNYRLLADPASGFYSPASLQKENKEQQP